MAQEEPLQQRLERLSFSSSWAQTLAYNAADRHVRTAVAGGPTVSYTRDGTDRITSRAEGSATTR